ncbi:MAG TPA: SDR family oxidoreductase [Acidimicrobiales bacterium]|nr:SDR family oxidoreductase [Acidimicrobiales bacterium]
MTLGPEEFLLGGRVAVVSGAAAGIGRAVAQAFARFGADLGLCDRDGEGLSSLAKELAPAQVVTSVLDVRRREETGAFVEEVARRFGRIDVLVNNAGGGFASPFERLSPRAQDALIAENFTAVADLTRQCLPWMGDGASIVNVTSIEAHRAGPGYSVYSAMKAAVASLTKTLALELGGRGIRVNCIAPDVIPTPGVGGEEGLGPVRTPLDRRGRPEDVAAAAVYLASPAAGFVTGTTIHVDGGNLAAGGWRRRADGSFST